MKFDIIIPMGCYCASAQALKSVKKRSRSLPFDWVGPLSFDQAVRFLETGFEGFLEKEDLVKYEKDTKKNVGYVNTRNNLLFLHDFKEVAHFDEEYVQLREKYERRIKRIYQTIRDSKDILYLHVHTPDMMDRLPADEELQAALERLRKMYPEKNHRLLFVNLAETEEGKTGFEKREIGGGIDYYDCYRDRDAAFDENFPGFVYFKKNVEAVLKAYKVRKNVKDVMKKFAFKLLDALSRLVPSRRVREKTRMLYKEYK